MQASLPLYQVLGNRFDEDPAHRRESIVSELWSYFFLQCAPPNALSEQRTDSRSLLPVGARLSCLRMDPLNQESAWSRTGAHAGSGG